MQNWDHVGGRPIIFSVTLFIEFNLQQVNLILKKQEYITVGCVPSAAVAAGGSVSQHALGKGVCIQACTGQGGCLPVRVSAQGGFLTSSCWLGYTPPPCEQNDRNLWKRNLAATTLRTVTTLHRDGFLSLEPNVCNNDDVTFMTWLLARDLCTETVFHQENHPWLSSGIFYAKK